jgi:hypothetical protein
MVLKTLPSAVAVISYAASESAGVFFPAPPPFWDSDRRASVIGPSIPLVLGSFLIAATVSFTQGRLYKFHMKFNG